MGCIRGGEETKYRGFVDHFVEWCGANHLMLNVNKPREMVVDFRRNRILLRKITTQGRKFRWWMTASNLEFTCTINWTEKDKADSTSFGSPLMYAISDAAHVLPVHGGKSIFLCGYLLR